MIDNISIRSNVGSLSKESQTNPMNEKQETHHTNGKSETNSMSENSDRHKLETNIAQGKYTYGAMGTDREEATESFCHELNGLISKRGQQICSEPMIEYVRYLENLWPHCFIVKSGVKSDHYFPWSSLFKEIDNSDDVCIVGDIVIPQIYEGTVELLYRRCDITDWQILVFGEAALMRYYLWVTELERRGFHDAHDHVIFLGNNTSILKATDYKRWAHQRYIYERRSHWMKHHTT